MKAIRLQKFFADCGIMSRRAAEEAIRNGQVTVNGITAEIGQQIDPEADIVALNGRCIKPRTGEYIYIMLNKPRGYVTTTKDPQGRKCVTDLLNGVGERVYPIGRLDMLSEGILLLTNDGELANRLTHPRHEIEKLYRVKVAGQVSDEQLTRLSSPMTIEGYEIQPVQVELQSSDESGTVLRMHLYEGRNRQIRRMCEEVGLTVKRLNRISIGNLKLNGLPVGRWRRLEPEEVAYLYRASEPKSKKATTAAGGGKAHA